MAIYQCFFFSEKRIRNWENVECETIASLGTMAAVVPPPVRPLYPPSDLGRDHRALRPHRGQQRWRQ